MKLWAAHVETIDQGLPIETEEGGGADTTWTQYSDRESEFQRPSTSAERRRRGISTVSMSEEQLLAHAQGLQPKAAEAAVRELRRRGA